MERNEPGGCLFAILSLLRTRIEPGESDNEAPLPYRRNQFFITDSEKSFFRVLKSEAPDGFLITLKPRLGDLLFVPRGTQHSHRHRNRINQKHVDFLIVNEGTLEPVLAIELDDRSHERADRKTRDAFVDDAFNAAGVPLLRVQAARTYSPTLIRDKIRPILERRPENEPAASPASGKEPPLCPQCGDEMVKRKSRKPARKTRAFWGCSNYPHCKGIRPLG